MQPPTVAACRYRRDLVCRLLASADAPLADGLLPRDAREWQLLPRVQAQATVAWGRHRAASAEAAAKRRAAWADWVTTQAASRPSLLYQWCRGEAQPLPLPVDVGGVQSLAPRDAASVAADAWGRVWQAPRPTGAPHWRVHHDPLAARSLPPLTGDCLQSIARRLQPGKAAGLDSWRPEEFRLLPLECWHRLAQFYHLAERLGRWPAALSATLVVLLPKKGKRSVDQLRDVSILSLAYRLWAAARRDCVLAWERAVDGLDLGGPAAQDAWSAAWNMAVDADVASHEGRHLVGYFLDCVRAFASVDHGVLAAEAVAAGFPRPLLILALGMCASPRRLRVQGAVSGEVAAWRGICPGCGLAMALLHAHLRTSVILARAVSPIVRVRRMADDLGVHAEHDDPEEAGQAASAAFVVLRADLERKGMTLHVEKTLAMASTRPARRALRALHAGMRDPPPIVYSLRDLGIDVQWVYRATKVQAGRVSCAKHRARRVAALPAVPAFRTRAATAMLQAGVAYGVSAQGCSATFVRALRTLVRQAVVGRQPARRALEVDLALADRHRTIDPAVTIPCQVVHNWLLHGPPALRRRPALRGAWAAVAGVPTSPPGPLRVVIDALGLAGWAPVQPDLWRDPRGTEWALSDAPAIRQLFAADLEAAVFGSLAHRRADFGGLAAGLDRVASLPGDSVLGPPGSVARRLAPCIRGGGTWHPVRRVAAGFASSGACPLCQAPAAGILHRWWQCPAVLPAAVIRGTLASSSP